MSFRVLFFTLLVSFYTAAQRTLPSPVILVHGWTGSAETWNEFTDYLQNRAFLTVERNSLRYNLDCDYNRKTSYLYTDVCDYTGPLGNKDVYVVNFNVGSSMSSQSAAVKQGYALGAAIRRVLQATGADKVMLLGHSMGGLAIREYLQNPSNWPADGRHHIAKLATIGTPHQGSNFTGWNIGALAGFDENSEAVRDLRESYLFSNCTRGGQAIACPGVYLWGGQESAAWMKTNAFGGSNFYNLDVNCNGYAGDNITGLNQKPIHTDLDFACVIGGPANTDGVVSAKSQNLNALYAVGAELFYYSCNGDPLCHTNEPKKALIQMIQALDEPKKNLTEISLGGVHKGFFTGQPDGSVTDRDSYRLYVPQRGVLSFIASASQAAYGQISVTDPFGALVTRETIDAQGQRFVSVNAAGYYTVSVEGNSLGTWTTYEVSLGFCALPTLPLITAAGATEFCDGQSVTLSTAAGYDAYEWTKDGVRVTGTSPQLSVHQSGTFSVQGVKCGTVSKSLNTVTVIVRPGPLKPVIQKTDFPDRFLLTSNSPENNQWLYEGAPISGATAAIHEPQALGTYTVTVTKNGCSTSSEAIRVTMEPPVLTAMGANPLCEGDSLQLSTPGGFERYIFSDGTNEAVSDKNQRTVRQAGTYRVAVKRGKFTSPFSEPYSVTVNLRPPKPLVTLEGSGLKSSSPVYNQWYVNGEILPDSTGQYLRGIGSGAYRVRVTVNGCFSESDVFVMTALQTGSDVTVRVYPNPGDGRFWVAFSRPLSVRQLIIYDLRGEEIDRQLPTGSFSEKEFIQLKASPGTYLLRVITETGVYTVPFIILP